MEATMSEPRELVPEQTHTSSTCGGAARPEVNNLLTKIADTLSNIQQQQQPLPPSISSTTPLPPLSNLTNFDPSALLNSLTSQGVDSLLDSLTRGTSPLLSLPTSSIDLNNSLTTTPSQLPSITTSVFLPSSGLDNFNTLTTDTLTNISDGDDGGPPAVALTCTVSTGHEASALPPAILPDTIFTHDNNLLPATQEENITKTPTVLSASGENLPNNGPGVVITTAITQHTHVIPVTATQLPLSSSVPRGGALAINGVPAVTATVVARSVSAAIPLSILQPQGALMATALPSQQSSSLLSVAVTNPSPSHITQLPVTTSPSLITQLPVTISQPSPITHLPVSTTTTSTTPPAFTATPLTTNAVTNSNTTTPTGNLANEPQNVPLQLADTNDIITSQCDPPQLETIANDAITEGFPLMMQISTNEQGSTINNSKVTRSDDKLSLGLEPAQQVSSITQLISTTETSNNEINDQGPPHAIETESAHQPSPPSLHANEELLSEESDDCGMDTSTTNLPPPSSTVILPSNNRSRSNSASPYMDDASFASFVAGEAHDSGSVMDEDHFSPSPSPLPSVTQSIDALVTQLHNQPTSSSSQMAMQAQFGVTAYCPRNPINIPSNAPPAPLNMTVQNFPKRSKYAHRAALSAMHPYHRTRGGGVNVAKTLDLLKAVLQSSFNMEVKRLCDDYLSLYQQAASNIRENTGDTVPDATLRLLVNKMMEEAQNGYQKGEWEFPSSKLPRNEKVAPAKSSPMTTKKVKGEKGEARYGPPKRSRRPPTDHHSNEKTSWKWSMDKKRVDPGKWKPDTLSADTYFVLGVNVNKALGHGANRGKVYYLHPELFKYACDGDDKTWLYENKYLPVHGGKAFLMIQKEVKFLVTSDDCYKDNKDILVSVKKLQEFKVPQFMLDKMKTFMRSVQGYFAQEASSSTNTNQQASHSNNDIPTTTAVVIESASQQQIKT